LYSQNHIGWCRFIFFYLFSFPLCFFYLLWLQFSRTFLSRHSSWCCLFDCFSSGLLLISSLISFPFFRFVMISYLFYQNFLKMMEHYINVPWQRNLSKLYLDRSYLLDEGASWDRTILVTYQHTITDRSINRIRRYIARRYGASEQILQAVRFTDKDCIIDIPNELSPHDIIAESREWGPTYGVTIEKFEGGLEWPRSAVVRVTVHLNNIPLRLWSRAMTTSILEDFGEPIFLDDVSFDG
jgi:hypothetical protein